MSYPYKAVALKKYKSPHKEDLSFAKGDEIRVVALAPKDDEEDDDDDDDDDQWLVGQSLDGLKTGTFPASHIQRLSEGEGTVPSGGEQVVSSAGGAAQDSIGSTNRKGEAAEDLAPTSKEAHTGPSEVMPNDRPSTTVIDSEVGGERPLENPIETPKAAALQNEKEEAVAPAEVPKEDVSAQLADVAADKQDDGKPASDPLEANAPVQQAVQTEAAPLKKPSSPPLAPKPSGLAARIAAFNKPSEAPPPLPKGKPGGWKRPPPAPGAPKPVLPGASPAQQDQQQKKTQTIPTTASSAESAAPSVVSSSEPDVAGEAATSGSGRSPTNAGFSAADAKSSIQLSLKDRMAALQRGGEAHTSAPTPAPKPAPKRIGADRRTAAMAGLGGPATAAAVDTELEPASSKAGEARDEAAADKTEEQRQSLAETTSENATVDGDTERSGAVATDSVDPAKVEDAEQKAKAPVEEEEEEGEEKTEEEKEAERRAAIARRMAALGGRRMGGGPTPMFGAPAPVPAPKPAKSKSADEESEAVAAEVIPPASKENPQEMEAETTKPEVSELESKQHTAMSTATAESNEARDTDEATSAPKTLAVPRRAAPPRRKRSAQPVEEEKERQNSFDSGSATSEAAIPPVPANTQATSLVTLPHEETGTVSSAALVDEPESRVESKNIDDLAEEAPLAAAASNVASGEKIEQARTGSLSIPGDEYGASTEPSPTTPASEIELREQARRLDEFVLSQQDREDTELSSRADEGLTFANQEEGDEEAGHDKIATGTTRDVEEKEEEEDDDAMQGKTARTASAVPPLPVSSPPPPSAAPPRPPSARPPVPKTPLSPPPPAPLVASEEVEGDRRSPAPTRAPPVPRAASRQGSTLAESVTALPTSTEEEMEREPPSQLAAPKPRMAVPVDDSDDEAEAAEDVNSSSYKEEEQTEEQQEASRRAKLAERMARMGAQPIMGAPMPIRRKPTREESRSVDERGPEANEEIGMGSSGGADGSHVGAEEEEEEEKAGNEDVQGANNEDLPATRLASPPPVPKSPPPIPSVSPPPRGSTPASRQSMSASDSIERRMSYRRGSESNDVSLGRRASQIRPPVPSVTHSRDTSAAQQSTPAEEEEEEEREGEAEDRFAAVIPDRQSTMSPPLLPSSPPPRAPPSRPAPQHDIEAVSAIAEADPEQAEVLQQRASIPPPTSSSSADPSRTGATSRSSRDLDLMPSTRWWRHGLHPVHLPPSLQRPDALVSVDVRGLPSHNNLARHLITVQLVYEDYSSTVVYVEFQDDDGEESATNVTQRHAPPPPRPSAAQLTMWSTQIGASLALQASAVVSSKSSGIATGSSRDFVANLVRANPQSLGPVGSSFGAIILAQAGSSTVDRGADEEVRPGDVVALHGADLKGKRGITNYHATFGTAQEPAFAIVIESESKKRKLRCVLQASGSSGSRTSSSAPKGPEEVSLRLDDVKGGLVRIFRVAPREGWLLQN